MDLVTIAFFVLIGWIVKVISDNRTKKFAIKNGNSKEALKELWSKAYANKPLQNIKWAMVFGGTGLTILIGILIGASESIILGVSFIIIAVCLIIYHYIEKIKR